MPRNQGGRPAVEIGREMIDAAKVALGECIFASPAATRLARKFKVGRDAAYRAIELARAEVLEGLQGTGGGDDPATATATFLMTTMASPKHTAKTKIDAASVLVRLLGLGRSVAGGSPSQVEEWIADQSRRQAERTGGGDKT